MTLPIRLLLLVVPIAALAIFASGYAIHGLTREAQKNMAIDQSRGLAQEVIDNAKAWQSTSAGTEILARRNFAQTDAKRPDCSRIINDRTVFLLRSPHEEQSSENVTWPRSVRDGQIISVEVKKGTQCLTRDAEAWGVARSYGGETFVIARVLPPELDMPWTELAVCAGIFAVFGTIAGGLFMAAHREQLAQVRQINAVLDQFDRSDHDVRVAETGGEEMRDLARHVNAMIARVQAMMANLSRLSIHIAHDLRSPLAVLSLQFDRMDKAMQRGQDVSEILPKARLQVDALMRRCVQLLDIVKIETSGRAQFEPVALSDDLQCLVDEIFEDLAEARGLEIDVLAADAVAVVAARGVIQQMFSNLLQNAIKFAADGSTIRTGVARRAHDAVFWVENDGPVIAGDRLEQIFEPGESAPVGEGGGYGLGLPFVRAAARRHGGDAVAIPLAGGMRFEARLALSRDR